MIADEDRCEAEVERIIRNPLDEGHGFMGSRQVHERRPGRCNRASVTIRPIYPVRGSREDSRMIKIPGRVCRQHDRGATRKWSVEE